MSSGSKLLPGATCSLLASLATSAFCLPSGGGVFLVLDDEDDEEESVASLLLLLLPLRFLLLDEAAVYSIEISEQVSLYMWGHRQLSKQTNKQIQARKSIQVGQEKR